MKNDREWIIVRIDGKIAAISKDYRMLAKISTGLAERCRSGTRKKDGRNTGTDSSCIYGEISAKAVGFEEVWRLRETIGWDDLTLSGTEFQKKVWRKLWELTHHAKQEARTADDTTAAEKQADKLICYSDFAELCQNRAGVRAVAHAVGLNPVAVIIPCHLVVPKETIDRMREIRRKAESTIFKGDDLCLGSILNDVGTDFGNYALGRTLKRELINMELFGAESTWTRFRQNVKKELPFSQPLQEP